MDKLAEGLVQSDRSSFVNSFSEPVEDSAFSPAARLVPSMLVNPLLCAFETFLTRIDLCYT